MRPVIVCRIAGWLMLIGGLATWVEDMDKAVSIVVAALPYICICAGLCLLLVPSNWWRQARKLYQQLMGSYGTELIYEIPFDRPLERPSWHVYGSKVLEFSNVDAADVGVSRGMRIVRENDDGICEHVLPSSYKDVKYIQFVLKEPSEGSCFRIVGIASKGECDVRFYLVVRIGEDTPKRAEDSHAWWTIGVKELPLGGGWSSVLLDVIHAWDHTLGTESWVLNHLESIDVCGSMTLAKITLKK